MDGAVVRKGSSAVKCLGKGLRPLQRVRVKRVGVRRDNVLRVVIVRPLHTIPQDNRHRAWRKCIAADLNRGAFRADKHGEENANYQKRHNLDDSSCSFFFSSL